MNLTVQAIFQTDILLAPPSHSSCTAAPCNHNPIPLSRDVHSGRIITLSTITTHQPTIMGWLER
jgi:hypothetical protein